LSAQTPEPAARERVYVVDDDAAVLRSVSRLLRAAGYDAASYASAQEFLAQVPPEAAGCVVLDLSMPGLDGLDLQRELAERDPGLPVVFVSGRGDVPKSVRAMKQGAVDFLTKPVKSDALLAAIEKALARDRERRRYGRLADEVRARIETLTAREREVLDGVVAGLLNKQIASRLGIAEQTVKVHRARVMEKMGAASLADLVRQADRARIRKS
jgi:FixJ family two-component response regulator